MKCQNCGAENAQNAVFCMSCGARQMTPQAPIADQPLAAQQTGLAVGFCEKLLNALRSGLFLAVCILFSAGTAAAMCMGQFDVINILLVIFLWLVYAKAQNNTLNVNGLRSISGAVFADYVIIWVLVGLFVVLGVFFLAAFDAMQTLGLFDKLADSGVFNEFPDLNREIGIALGAVLRFVIPVALLLAAGVLAVFNVFGTRAIHRFLQSVYRSAETGTEALCKCKAAGAWFLVFGIFSGISALSSLSMAFLSNGAMSAAMILMYVLIKKTFKQTP